MAKENRFGMMEVFMKDHGSMIMLRDGVDLFMPMAMCMRESGPMTWQTV